jgi:predicted transcriptional regulator
MSNTKHDLDTVIDAIRGTGQWLKNGQPNTSGGNLSAVARRLNVTRATVYNYVKRWKTVEDAIEEEKQGMLDFTENQLFKQVQAGNITAIIFTLKTLGKSRGYIERQEIKHSGGGKIIVSVED